MGTKGLRREGPEPSSWSPSTLLEALSTSFDDLEAYAYLSGGELILRSEYELLVIRVPRGLGYHDFAAYVERLGGQAYTCEKGLGIVLPTMSGPRLGFHARVIHVDRGGAYIAVEPRGVVSRNERPRLC